MKRFLWVFISGILFLIALGVFVLFQFQLSSNFKLARQRAMLIASNSALSVSADEVFSVPLEQTAEGSAEYLVVYRKLLLIKETNPCVKYAYIMAATSQPGILQYVVDADPVPQIITAKCPTSLPGDKYDARQFSEMLNAFNGPSADKKITSDEWGVFISGYAPIYDAGGKSVAILGIDTDAVFMQVMQERARVSGRVALFAGVLFIILLAATSAKNQ
ncbi:MAG: hypothetical protein PHR84_04490 [Candidatus Omnitrophica bacterium]|jgi:hypothetical protein|nr:hypothetical protein [Candidatus Omnitrophota bacterium]MDD5660261.1 hypothetical protein [Candidatus Omnitrophota bacterium]